MGISKLGKRHQGREMAGTRKVFPTKFVWDNGGSEVCLAINGGPPVKLQREEDGTFEVTHNRLQNLISLCR